MSKTYRRTSYFIFRAPKTFNELKQQHSDYNESQYSVNIKKRYIPTLYDDITISASKELDHHQ